MDPDTDSHSPRDAAGGRLDADYSGLLSMKFPTESAHVVGAPDHPPWCVIFNPASGTAGARVDPKDINLHLRSAGIEFELHETQDSAGAERVAGLAYAAGWRKFIIAGGDGTAHQVLNGLMAERSPVADDLTLAILPIGTGNDWSRSLGVSRNLQQSCALIANGCAVPIDVGQVTFLHEDSQVTRYFLNICGAGLDAHVVHTTASLRPGRWQYFSGLIHGARSFIVPCIDVETPGWRRSAPTLDVLVCNGGFLGGGMRIAPKARSDDGLFEVIVVDDMSFATIIAHIPQLLFGSLSGSRRVRVLKTASLEIGGDTPIQCDGELLGRTPARIRILPAAIRVKMGSNQCRTRS